ncbi:MAG: CsbD family protein [Flavobacteriales bacterium]
MMNTTELLGQWNQKKGKLKQMFAELTDDDLLFAEGALDEMKGRLQIKLGKTKDELDLIFSTL